MRRLTCSRILLAAEDEEEAGALAQFVEAAFAACEPFPGRLRAHLRANLSEILGGWARSAAAVPALRSRGLALFSSLLEAPDEDLGRVVFDLLKSSDGEGREAAGLPDFGLEVLRTRLRGASPE